MSNNLPEFLPPQLPSAPILDLSASLSSSATEALNNVTSGLGYSAKVVVLPKSYYCPDARQLTLDLAKSWNIDGEGKTLLLVVDLKGHKVRAHGSPELNRTGVTSDYITDSLIPHQFVPYMRRGDLATAIRLTLLDVDHVQKHSQGEEATELTAPAYTAAESSTPQQYSAAQSYGGRPTYPGYDAPVAQAPPFPFLSVFAILAAGACLLNFGGRYIQLLENKKQYANLLINIDALFAKTDKLGQVGDFLEPSSQVPLCHEIADYFAKIATLQNAQAQVERLLKNGIVSTGQAERAITKCRQYAGAMEVLTADLLRRVEVATGTKNTYEPNANIEVLSPPDSKPRQIEKSATTGGATINTSYRAPRWSNEPAYVRTVNDDPINFISTYIAQRDRASIPVSYHADASDGGGSWGRGSSSSRSTSSSSDGGGSWDSSSSSSDSSDSSSDSSSDGGGSW